MSEWADRYRRLDALNCAEPGRWRNQRTPYLVEPMDALSDPRVEWLVVASGAQLGKTEVLLNFLGWIVDEDPGPTLLVYPREADADKFCKQRIHSAVIESPKWRDHVSSSDALGIKAMLFDTCKVDTAWSNSPAALSSTPYRFVLFDEVSKFPLFSGRDANPLALGAMRTASYQFRRKLVAVSTPLRVDDLIWLEFNRASIYRYFVPCPRCSFRQVLDFHEGLRWPKEVAISEIRDRDLAYYVCGRCGSELRQEDKEGMVARGRWVPDGSTIEDDGEIVGPTVRRRRVAYHLSVLLSPFVPWSAVACQWLEAQGDESALMEFVTQWLGQPWQPKVETIKDSHIRARKSDYPTGVVPKGGRKLLAFVDVQEDHFWFVVRAFGLEERSWLVRWGRVVTWADVERVIGARYPTADGGTLEVELCFVDSGNKPATIYEWTRAHRPVTWPSKASGRLLYTVKLGTPEPGTILYNYRKDYFADRLARAIQTERGEPGEWNLPEDLEDEETYLRHLTAEQRVRKKVGGQFVYKWEQLHGDNHGFDCEVGLMAVAEIAQVRFMHLEQTPAPESPSGRGVDFDDEDWGEFDLEDPGDFLP